jgi:hypothetical protein
VAEWRFVESIRQRTAGEFVGEKRVVKAVLPAVLEKNEEPTTTSSAATSASK